jgi:vacuolar-type H+-ATPase subunit E/Vma4
MPPLESNGPELLRHEIIEEARRESEEILGRARETAARLTTKAEQEAAKARTEKLDGARAEAKRRQEAILATISVETNRMRLARIEQWLEDVHDRAGERLTTRDGVPEREALAELAAQALHSMTGDQFVMRLPPGDLPRLGDAFLEEVQRHGAPAVKLRFEAATGMKKGSCLLLDDEGRQMWDIGLKPRLERLWPELRRQIAAQLGFVEKPESRGV